LNVPATPNAHRSARFQPITDNKRVPDANPKMSYHVRTDWEELVIILEINADFGTQMTVNQS
jgi:hypothetical protein